MASETEVAAVEGGRLGAFTPAERAAILLADWVMAQPGDIPADLIAELHTHFTAEQLVELVLDTLKWNTQKVPVALGVDVRLDGDGHAPALLKFGADGDAIVDRR